MLFFQYLEEKKILNKDQVIQILIAQMESMPSLLRILKEDNLLSSDELYQFILMASKDEKGLYDIIKEKSGLTENDLREAFDRQNQASLSIGKIIIDLGLLDQDTFDKALRNFHKDHGNNTEKKASITKTSPAATAAPAISAAALESLKEVSQLSDDIMQELESKVTQTQSSSHVDEDILNIDETQDQSNQNSIYFEEFLDNYSDGTQSDLIVIANRFRLKGKRKDAELLQQSLLKLLSLAKLNNFEFFPKILNPYNDFLSEYLNNEEMECEESLLQMPLQMLDILWQMRNSIKESGKETSFFKDVKKKEKFIQHIRKFLSLMKR